jgi:hypothetical protein
MQQTNLPRMWRRAQPAFLLQGWIPVGARARSRRARDQRLRGFRGRACGDICEPTHQDIRRWRLSRARAVRRSNGGTD